MSIQSFYRCLLIALFGLLIGSDDLLSAEQTTEQVNARIFAGAEQEHDHSDEDRPEVREAAQKRVQWQAPNLPPDPSSWLDVKLLAINDFHGQISSGRLVGGRPVGSAAVLGSYLQAAQLDNRTLIVHAGDHVGASPPSSALLQDEPSILFLNMIANKYCSPKHPLYTPKHRFNRAYRFDPRCNLVGTPGNHEFDEGAGEMFRLIQGGNHDLGPFLVDPYPGAAFPYVSSNVVDAETGKPIFAPYVIKKIKGMPVGFIGAVLKETPTIVTPTGVAGLSFVDEVSAINQSVSKLKAQRVRSIVVLIHQGGQQPLYTGPTGTTAGPLTGPIVDIVTHLDDEVDVVVSGHSHSFSNALVKNQNGKEILVTQAFSAGTAFADIDLEIDPVTKDVMTKSAAVVTTYADAGPGLQPDPEIAQMVAQAESAVAPLVNQVISEALTDILRTQNSAGESALGNLIADAQRAYMGTDFAFMNPGGIRADLLAGTITWGELFTVQPFGNSLVKMDLTGDQVYQLLNQQWLNQPFPRMLQISGLTYTWDNNLPVGDRIVEVRKDGIPIDKTAVFTVTVNSFMAAGGDNFTVLTQGTNQVGGPIDLDALIGYIQILPQPFTASVEGRITRLN